MYVHFCVLVFLYNLRRFLFAFRHGGLSWVVAFVKYLDGTYLCACHSSHIESGVKSKLEAEIPWVQWLRVFVTETAKQTIKIQ